MAQATMAANPALKETYVQLKARMDKASKTSVAKWQPPAPAAPPST